MPASSQTRPTSIGALVALFLVFTLLLCVAAMVLGGQAFGSVGLLGSFRSPFPPRPVTQPTDAPGAGASSDAAPITCVVIDAGHGGEDGGASSAEGLTEKDVNLAVAEALRDLFEASGIPTVMTRTEDKLLYDRGVDYRGRKKVLDLAARRLIAEETEGCLFISIHMNAFPQTQYSGMQVWYGTGDERSAEIARAIQSASTSLMPTNHRKSKAAGSNIYLLDRIESPAVLVECGFLSNPEEARRLSDETYRRALAMVIYGAVLPYLSK